MAVFLISARDFPTTCTALKGLPSGVKTLQGTFLPRFVIFLASCSRRVIWGLTNLIRLAIFCSSRESKVIRIYYRNFLEKISGEKQIAKKIATSS
jgi:hypothetical protein